MTILTQLIATLGTAVEESKNISPFLTLRTSTIAEYYFAAKTREDLIKAIVTAKEIGIPFFMLGGGSNLAVLQDTIGGLVIHNRYIRKEIIADTQDYTDILFSSGYPMSLIVKETTDAGLAGFEYHLGLPGTLGGAIYMNSKWTKPVSYCSDALLYGWILNRNGEIRKVEKDYFEFAYDYSVLQETKEIVVEGVFRLKKEQRELLKKRSQEALQYRKDTQPFGVATGGCFFRNISDQEKERAGLETVSAGYMIDHAGLKGKRMGSFIVSDKHANFIINTGEGKPADLRALLHLIKSTIKEKYGVELVEEVCII